MYAHFRFKLLFALAAMLCASHLMPLRAVNAQETTKKSKTEAQQQNKIEDEKTHQEEALAEAKLRSQVESLTSIASAIKRNESSIKEAQKTLNSGAGTGREEELKIEIQALADDLRSLEESFRQIAAGTDTSILRKDPNQTELSLGDELTGLLKPLLSELQQLTQTPREIDNLRAEQTLIQQRLKVLSKAEEHTNRLLAEKPADQKTQRLLSATKSHWQQAKDELLAKLEIKEQQLNQKLDNRTPLSESFSNVFELFFKKRGRNLLVAFLLATLCYLLIRWVFDSIQRIPQLRKKSSSYTYKVITLSSLLARVIGSVAVFIMVLYFTGDWLLLTLALLVLFGLIWASREQLPKYSSQVGLLLDFGPVREGERVAINGVSYQVMKINLYSKLKNPALTGGTLRLPIADLVDLRSRAAEKKEPFFPSKEHDWVLLQNGIFGRVHLQTPDSVQLIELGGAMHTMNTSDYLAQSPNCLSRGFRCYISFGLDYAHQAIITRDIPEKLHSYIDQGLTDAEFNFEDAKLTVEFESAGGSSLNLAVIYDVPGGHAREYKRLNRTLQRIIVDACNEYKWIIPFEQLTVHMANEVAIANQSS